MDEKERIVQLLYNTVNALKVEMDEPTLRDFCITEIGFTEEEYKIYIEDRYK